MPKSIDELLEEARERLERVTPEQAYAELQEGAILVDHRTFEQRRDHGDIPGAVQIDRTVLEWRLDPQSEWRIPAVTGHRSRVILICQEGYSSSLAAATLQELGLERATDVAGGFEAWRDADLPVAGGRHAGR